MATQTHKSNGRGEGTNGAQAFRVDLGLVRERAVRVTDSANGIARIADAVADGADTQLRALDEAAGGVNQMAAVTLLSAAAGVG